MKYQTFIWLLCLNIRIECLARQFILQNEMSEHCRRRVISSVFLGREVAESSAEVMHFSRLELPYSCSISVRTESGSNIILVILSKSEKSIINSCAKGNDQLLVYEMGETFGGYWGALPESVFRKESHNKTTYYTLQTTEHATETTDTGVTDYDVTNYTEEVVSLTTRHEATDKNYVVMEVPLVNVSGNIELGKEEPTTSEENDLFDFIYDVTPKNGVLYDTSLMPLVQFSIWKQNEALRGFENTEPRYQLDYNVHGFTPDFRLTFPMNIHRGKFSNRPRLSTRRAKKKKRKQLFAVKNWTPRRQNENIRYRFNSEPEYITELLTTTKPKNKDVLDFSLFKNSSDTWQVIENYLNLHNANNLTSTETKDNKTLPLLKKISNMKHNASVYLQSNLSKYNDLTLSSKVQKKNIPTEQKYIKEHFSRTFPIRLNISSLRNATSTAAAKTQITVATTSSIYKHYIEQYRTTEIPININHQERLGGLLSPVEQLTTTMTEKRKSESGSLVDHESWENIVQVAPVMADLLNATTPFIQDNATFISEEVLKYTNSVELQNKTNRNKRYIQALFINQHRPHQLSTKKYTIPPNRIQEQFDSKRLAEFVELNDDEIQGRVALHYYKNYIGSTMFNMCDYQEAKTRQVYLFNSSRILIAINNFTMERITIIMTESRTVRPTGCPPAHLECQVSGVRVCVHYMNACDGLPNCGAYEIYDEDRLLCGVTVGFHYMVCLAACTFLVLLLTMLYSIHYWLKRCVPKVSQAFFVYTDKSENILYLNSIMRSPNDDDEGSRIVYHSSFFDDDDLSDSMKEDDKKLLNIVMTFLRVLFCKKPKRQSSDDESHHDASYGAYTEPKVKYSFTEQELRKIGQLNTTDVSVQTGDSLQMAQLKQTSALEKPHTQLSKQSPVYSKKQSDKELSALRRIRSISASMQSSSQNLSANKLKQNQNKYPVPAEDEVELRSTLYDKKGKGSKDMTRHVLERTNYEIHPEPPDLKRIALKHLRFEEGPTTIEPSALELNADERRKVPLNTDRFANIDLDVIKEDEEGTTASGSGRDFRRFWSKGKKNKKKTHSSSR